MEFFKPKIYVLKVLRAKSFFLEVFKSRLYV